MGASIVVVSADERTRRGVETLLCAQGYVVGTASSFIDGQELLDSVTPDLVIADLRLNDHNGLQLATQTHLDRPDVAVMVITSARDDWWAEDEATRQGAAFIANPLENPDFLPCVRQALTSRRPAQTPTRRWFRHSAAVPVPLRAASGRAQIVDMSYGGVRLAFSGPRVISPAFEITLPSGGVTVQARCVWTRSSADGQFYCGAALAEDSALPWREFVDSLQGRRTVSSRLRDVPL